MVVRYWWMLLVWLATVIILGIVWRMRLKRHRSNRIDDSSAVVIAHRNRLTELPSYQLLLARYRWWVRLLAACLVLAITGGLLLSMRLGNLTVTDPDIRNRDIMLCLDISGSMRETNYQVVSTYTKLAEKFDGERIGLTVFDSSASTIFPLTNDYDYIKTRLADVASQLKDTDFSKPNSIYDGTDEGQGSSLVGDGLASCVTRFDTLDTKRSRSVLLATDNYANGAQIIDLKQAGAFARDKGVRVYGINPSDSSTGSYVDNDAMEFHDVVMATDGAYFKVDSEQVADASVVQQIVDHITRQEATRYKGAAQVVRSDTPLVPAVLLLSGIAGLLVVAWRLRL